MASDRRPPYNHQPHPPYADLTGNVVVIEEHYFAYGAVSDVWKGLWKCDDRGNKLVAVKALRGTPSEIERNRKIREAIDREKFLWVRLDHPNVLPFYGYCNIGKSLFPALVSMYCANGNVITCLEAYPNADRNGIVVGISRGLKYLHDNKTIHGDMKPSNILIDDNWSPRIGDFGCSRVDELSGFTATLRITYRYAAPELTLVTEGDPLVRATWQADIYSAAVVYLQILSDKTPFHHVPEQQILMHVMQHKRPDLNHHKCELLTPPMRELLNKCLSDAAHRPGASEVARKLERITASP